MNLNLYKDEVEFLEILADLQKKHETVDPADLVSESNFDACEVGRLMNSLLWKNAIRVMTAKGQIPHDDVQPEPWALLRAKVLQARGLEISYDHKALGDRL